MNFRRVVFPVFYAVIQKIQNESKIMYVVIIALGLNGTHTHTHKKMGIRTLFQELNSRYII